jgi:putative lipoic acid-binding regulatory protein
MTDEEQRLLELLEAQHDFPGPYGFKVICRNQPGTPEGIVAALHAETRLTLESDGGDLRSSRGGKYVSFKVVLQATTASDVLAVYARLRSYDSVIQYF